MPLYKFSQLFAGVWPGGFVFGLEGFVREGFCPFLLLSQYICYNRKLNITLNFTFNMYDKKYISVTSHALDTLLLSQTVTPTRTPSPLERDVGLLYGRPLRICQRKLRVNRE